MIAIALITLFMGYKAQEIEMTYDFAKVVPSHDPDMEYFQRFKEMYGEDGNILVVGLQDSAIYTPQNFLRFKFLSEEIASLHGVSQVMALPLMFQLEKDVANRKFKLTNIFDTVPDTQHELDSLLHVALNQKLYSGQLINEENGATLLLVVIDEKILNSENRQRLIDDLVHAGDLFTEATGMDLHYAGLPFVRSILATKVQEEMKFFLYLSAAVTALILLFFFRTWNAVVFPMLVIGVMVIWVMGTLALFEYKITLLTGLIPPIIVVIGVPNCVYLLNKYHQEYGRHHNKILALSRIVSKIGIVTLMTNFTTAVGFIVLAFTDIVILKEFGTVAGINIFATFIVSIILIPAVFSYLPPPKARHLKHLEFKPLTKALTGLDLLVHRHKYTIFVITGAIVVISIVGVSRIQAVSYLVDDIPEESSIMKDLKFFEQNFAGVMPLEFVVDTGKKKGVMQLSNMRLVDEFQTFLGAQPHISPPISLATFVKAAKQAYYNGNPDFYSLPNNQERNFIFRYLAGEGDNIDLLNSFVDSTGQTMRISTKVADIGSVRMDSLLSNVIHPEIEKIFGDSDIDVTVTGTTPLFIKGNIFLIENLWTSMILAFVIIALMIGLLFGNWRMIMVSLVPNLIPLIITGGLMGYLNIPLKPSTALIFSIAFGISIDDSIHFLARYRQELFANNFFVPIAVSKALRETGSSMIYTSIVLFAGFVIFSASDFGGTAALGKLTSMTLLCAISTNLILLPSLLLAFDDGKRKKDFHPLIEHYDEFYQEDEDEEIDLELIAVKKLEPAGNDDFESNA